MEVPLSHNYKAWGQRSQKSCRREALHHRSPTLTKARGKTLYLPLTATSTDSSVQQLNWISSLDRGDPGERQRLWKEKESNTTLHLISTPPPFTLPLKRTPPPPLEGQQPLRATPARLVVLMFKMAPVTNYRREFPGASATLAAEFFPALLPAAAVAVPKSPPPSCGLKGRPSQSWRTCCHPVLMSLCQLLLLDVAGLKWAEAGRTFVGVC